MAIDLSTLTIKKTHEALKNRHFSAVELLDSYLEKCAHDNKKLNIFLELFADARERAEDVDHTIHSMSRIDLEKKLPLLAGIPIAMKDNILIKGKIASSSSKMLENYRATYDATVTTKLKDEMAVFIGRTNMDEFAMGGSTENSAFGATKNPHDTKRVPGGSSGGSAAAVAADMALASLGSDTGGSVRQPASFCGVVGMKPTYGAVSRYGLMAMASSLDQIGPLTKTVEDAEIVYNAIRGHDPMDSTSLPDDRFSSSLPSTKRIGVPLDFLKKGVDKDVLERFNEVTARFKKLGYEIVPVDLPYIAHSLAVYYILMPAEASANLARFDGVRYGFHKDGANLLEDYLKSRGEGFGAEVRRRILLGTYVLSAGYYDAYYKKATRVQQLIRDDFAKVFAVGEKSFGVDAILTPTAPTPAFKIGEKSGDPLSMYLADIFTVPANIAGLPALSFPAGTVERDGKKLPVGMQLMAPHYGEEVLFTLGKEFSDTAL
jgi:aspartyl-tRNA(Asn)/glutamyl-tRNA(Gln) amidotransferase subunit A